MKVCSFLLSMIYFSLAPDLTNISVTIVTTDEGSTLGNMVFEVSHHTDHTDHDQISVSVTGMADAATTASLIQEAITHAEI